MMQMAPEKDFQTIKAIFLEESDIVVNKFQYFLKHFNILYLKALNIAIRMKVENFEYLNDDDFHKNINRVLSKIVEMDKYEYREYSNQLSSVGTQRI